MNFICPLVLFLSSFFIYRAFSPFVCSSQLNSFANNLREQGHLKQSMQFLPLNLSFSFDNAHNTRYDTARIILWYISLKNSYTYIGPKECIEDHYRVYYWFIF